MTQRHKQRLFFVVILLAGFSAAAILMLYALEENLLYFYTPSQVADDIPPEGRTFNLGGVVVVGSVRRSQAIHFAITDYKGTVEVVYNDILPDLFAEGQGVIATGRLDPDGTFIADTVLAKHDENYMPPNVAESLHPAPMNMPMPSFEQ